MSLHGNISLAPGVCPFLVGVHANVSTKARYNLLGAAYPAIGIFPSFSLPKLFARSTNCIEIAKLYVFTK